MNSSVNCHINPNAVRELASGDWPNLEELLIGKNSSMKFVINNLGMKNADN